MRKILFTFITCIFLYVPGKAQSPSVEVFKKVFNDHMQKLISPGYTKRNICFVQVTPGTPNGGYYPFKVTAYVHDYGPGYPANKYYGQTCLGKMDGWKFDMRKDAFGDWIVQGRFSVTKSECKDNPSEGAESIPLASVPAPPYKPGAVNNTKNNPATKTQQKPTESVFANLYLGEYACYGTGGRLMAGMGFILLPGGKYFDVDKKRGGTYTYSSLTSTIRFNGGFLSGQVGKNVKQTGFQLSSTVTAEPWR